jgi:hypothetical protein
MAASLFGSAAGADCIMQVRQSAWVPIALIRYEIEPPTYFKKLGVKADNASINFLVSLATLNGYARLRNFRPTRVSLCQVC